MTPLSAALERRTSPPIDRECVKVKAHHAALMRLARRLYHEKLDGFYPAKEADAMFDRTVANLGARVD